MGMRSEICRLFKRITHCAEDSNFLRRLFSRESAKRYLLELLAMTNSASQIKQNHVSFSCFSVKRSCTSIIFLIFFQPNLLILDP